MAILNIGFKIDLSGVHVDEASLLSGLEVLSEIVILFIVMKCLVYL